MLLCQEKNFATTATNINSNQRSCDLFLKTIFFIFVSTKYKAQLSCMHIGILVFQQILYFSFPTISSRRPNGVYIRGGGSINLWFRSADNKLLLIKCSATYKLKPQISPRSAKFKVSHKRYRWVDGKWALDWCVCERKAVKASLKRSFQQERRQILWNNQLKGVMERK